MTGWPSVLAAGVLLAVPHHVLFTFADPAVVESSGLVDRGERVYTINDSGDGPVVYGIDPATGETVGRTTYSSGSVEDVEALAPGKHGTLWVGDTGDNQHARDDIAVYHVRPGGSGDAPRYGLVYPDGAHDAETLLVQPRTQRVFVVSKSVFGGTVYVAPRHLRAGVDNRLRPFAKVAGLVTDGTFFPDGRHVLLRTYTTASVYTFPDFGLVGTVRLPSQQQGEGISVGPGGRVLVSSEGLHAPVLQVSLPASLNESPAAPTTPTAPAAPTTPTATAAPGRSASPGAPARGGRAWWETGLLALVALGGGAAAVRLARTRSR